jgi:hypothetical protein
MRIVIVGEWLSLGAKLCWLCGSTLELLPFNHQPKIAALVTESLLPLVVDGHNLR